MKPLDSSTGRGKALRLAVTGLIALASVHYISSISSETASQLEAQTKFSFRNPYSRRQVEKRGQVQKPTRRTLHNPSRKKPVPRVKILNITSFSGIDQNNPGLVAYVRQRMRSPAPTSQPYNLLNPEKTDFSQCNQSAYADKEFLHGMWFLTVLLSNLH
ncbi:uncharacterized protein LOC125034951 [Penaeus chinensis]|uniref:uncharacterized protein LOC125034951 n=1 Tax=Penaeus chinensis TaxID=139456 RepID=UPI001FB78488|nr:uncharacterized protein LOC125034951 [Penaeus chinensis]